MTYYYKVDQIRVPFEYTRKIVEKNVISHCRISSAFLLSSKIIKRALDTRKEPQFVLTLQLTTNKPIKFSHSSITQIDAPQAIKDVPLLGEQKYQPVVIGAGPAGLTAAWILAKAGLKPILIERGEDALTRQKKVNRFWNRGELDSNSNVLFGEGGAGLFSDGKLTARSKAKDEIRTFLQLLVNHGADSLTLIDSHPHIGSDRLLKIVPSIREEIKKLGGTVLFSETLTDIVIENSKITAIKTDKQEIKTDRLVLAIGHSARDSYKMLLKNGVQMSPKSFAVGLRVELSQDIINRTQYKKFDPKFGAAEFRLTRKPELDSRACYSFCMCPGGQVISCASDDGMLTSNGMSFSKRSLPLGNAAFLVPVTPEDYKKYGDDALAGVKFQEDLEKKAYIAGGKEYALPASSLKDYLQNSTPTEMPKQYSPHRIKLANLNEIIPDFMNKTLHNSLPKMLKQIGSPNPADIMLYGTETRSSAPLQILREKTGESINTKGLYPTGEGAGYAGGIVSSGVDGVKVALSIINSYQLVE